MISRPCQTCGGDRVVQTDTHDPQDAVDVDCPDCELGAHCEDCGLDLDIDQPCPACAPDEDDVCMGSAA